MSNLQDDCQIPVTIKCRIGVDQMDEEKGLDDFVDEVSAENVDVFIIHARIAILNGLTPKQNREIPPLKYERVAALKKRRPDLKIIINGGITSITQGLDLQKRYGLDGFMIGREAYKNPYILSSVDKDVFNKEIKTKSRYQIAMQMANYIDHYMKYKDGNVHSIIRHILGLYNSLPGAKYWRQELSENARFAKNGDILRFATENIEKLINKENSVLV